MFFITKGGKMEYFFIKIATACGVNFMKYFFKISTAKRKKIIESAEQMLPIFGKLCEEMQKYVFSCKCNVGKVDVISYDCITILLEEARKYYMKYTISLPEKLSKEICDFLESIDLYYKRYTFLKNITEPGNKDYDVTHTQEEVDEKRKIVSIVQGQLPKKLEVVKQQFSKSIN